MRCRSLVTLLLAILFSGDLFAQTPSKTKTGSRVKKAVAKLADTLATETASMATDSLLGTRGGAIASLVTGSPASAPPSCPAGTVAYANPAAGPAAAPAMAMPSAGSMIIGAAKKKLAAKKAGAAAAAAAPATPQYLCGTPDQATAAVQASQAQAMAQQPKMDAKSMLAATPQGMLVTGAIAAAPMAGDAAKKLGGMLGRGKQNSESMRKDLARGRLQLRGIKFVNGGDEMAAGFEKDIEALTQALQTVEGQFLLNVPAESDGQSSPDTLMAIRRLTRLSAHLQVAGIPDSRVTVRGVHPAGLDAKSTPPKPGQTRAEIIRFTEVKP
ncbi:MAG: hypothetical protein H7Z74_12580 [Anaerolineae bacterium]|nr:hypothetical protein [Gemmatimonadaceae bacterium]